MVGGDGEHSGNCSLAVFFFKLLQNGFVEHVCIRTNRKGSFYYDWPIFPVAGEIYLKSQHLLQLVYFSYGLGKLLLTNFDFGIEHP